MKVLKKLRPAYSFTTNVTCGLVHPFRDEYVVGCGATGRLEQFYYQLDDHNLTSSVSLCRDCKRKQMERQVRFDKGQAVTFIPPRGGYAPGTIEQVIGFRRAGQVYARTGVYYKVRYQPEGADMPVVALVPQEQIFEVK